jgi:cation diffusion facilitator family transporter
MQKFNWTDDGYFVTDTRDLAHIRRVLIITMLLNFAATAVKLGAGIATGAISVIADALDSLFDGLSNIVGLAGLYAAAKPPDAEHPYGHRKFETLAALSIAILLFVTTGQLLQAAWERLRSGGEPVLINPWTIGALVLSMGIQAVTSYYELRQGRQLKSEILVADALHTRASILVSFSVLVGLILVRLGFRQADPILAIGVALLIAKIGVDILRDNLPVLLDQAPVDPNQIASIVRSVNGVESFHRVRSRGAQGSAAVDLHIRVSPDRTISEADAIADEVRRRLLELSQINDVTLHLEAQRPEGPDAPALFAVLKHAADALGITIHESWAHRVDGNLVVEVHIGVEPSLTIGEAHTLADRLEWDVRRRLSEVHTLRTHIEMASTRVQEALQVPEELEEMVQRAAQNVIEAIPEISSPRNIAVSRLPEDGKGYRVSLDCTIAGDTPVTVAHQLADRVEHELCQQLDGVIDILVHLEPDN